MNTTITVRRDHVGRYATKNLFTRFLFFLARTAYWLLKAPFRLFYAVMEAFYWGLSLTLPSRATAFKIMKYQLVITSLVLNLFLARQIFVVRCSAGGMFMTQEKCGELAQAKFDSMELAREQFLQDNADILR